MSIYKAPVYMLIVVVVLLILLIVGYLYLSLYKYKLQAIEAGLEDELIKKEYKQNSGKFSKIADIISVIITLVIFSFFIASVYADKTGNFFKINGFNSLQVVASGSMSYKKESNTYLEENNLNNQFDTYDIIGISPLESEKNLSLYDVIIYKYNDKLIAHRIIDVIEEENTIKYILRGDANNSNDAKPVTYEQVVGKYNGFRIPAMGIFVIFLQSALGYVAMGLVLILEFVTPYFEKKVDKAIKARLKTIGYIE